MVDAVGFDFINTPEIEYKVGRVMPEGELLEEAFIEIERFSSDVGPASDVQAKGGKASLSMVMLDFDYDAELDVFDLDEVFYAAAIEENGWEVRFPADRLGAKVMAVFLDIFGNEARIVIPREDFGVAALVKVSRAKTGKRRRRQVWAERGNKDGARTYGR